MLKKKDFIPSFILSMFENGVCSLVDVMWAAIKPNFLVMSKVRKKRWNKNKSKQHEQQQKQKKNCWERYRNVLLDSYHQSQEEACK